MSKAQLMASGSALSGNSQLKSSSPVQKRILVADDDRDILDAIQMLLEDEGYIVETRLEGASVMELQEYLPDLVILDIWMSGVDGRDICKYLKSHQRTKHLPVILISAGRDAGLSARAAGADEFIAKPFDTDFLLERIEKILKKNV